MISSLLIMTKSTKGQIRKVTRHNDLIEAKMDLSTMQLRIFLGTVVQIKKEDIDFKPYQVVVKDLLKECGITSQSWYSMLKEEAERLSEVKLKLPKENREDFLYASLFSSVEYKSNLGVLELSFDPKLKPYLLQLKGNFTTYELQYVFPMKSQYSIRLYELLKQYATFGKRCFTLENLRYILSLEDKYSNFADFKRRVIEPAKKECIKYSDITFSYNPIKQGKKTVALEFFIKRKVDFKDIEVEQKTILISHSNFVQELLNAGLSEQRISEILDKYETEEYLKFVWEKTKVQNPKKLDSFFLKALQEEYYKTQYKALQDTKIKNKVKIVEQDKKRKEDALKHEFHVQYVEARDETEFKPTKADKNAFEKVMKERIAQAPAFQIMFDTYLQTGTSNEFRDFLLKKYGKPSQYNFEEYIKSK